MVEAWREKDYSPFLISRLARIPRPPVLPEFAVLFLPLGGVNRVQPLVVPVDQGTAVPTRSLLVVWTRYRGPDGVFPDESSDPRPEGTAAGHTSPGDSHHSDDDAAVRSVEPVFLRPGQTFTGTVTLPRVSGRMLLREHVPVEEITIESVDPSSVDAVTDGQTIYVAWEVDEPTTATLEYVAAVPPNVADGTELAFDSDIQTDRGRRSVTGTTTVEVVADVFERALANGDVAQEDLRVAGEALRAGELSSKQFERLYTEWLRQIDSPESAEETVPPAPQGEDDD